jgi:hypothetical protein
MKSKIVLITGGRWPGALAVVEEDRSWGVVGFMPIPDDMGIGKAHVRIPNGEFIHVGEVDTPAEWGT